MVTTHLKQTPPPPPPRKQKTAEAKNAGKATNNSRDEKGVPSM